MSNKSFVYRDAAHVSGRSKTAAPPYGRLLAARNSIVCHAELVARALYPLFASSRYAYCNL